MMMVAKQHTVYWGLGVRWAEIPADRQVSLHLAETTTSLRRHRPPLLGCCVLCNLGPASPWEGQGAGRRPNQSPVSRRKAGSVGVLAAAFPLILAALPPGWPFPRSRRP